MKSIEMITDSLLESLGFKKTQSSWVLNGDIFKGEHYIAEVSCGNRVVSVSNTHLHIDGYSGVDSVHKCNAGVCDLETALRMCELDKIADELVKKRNG